MPTQQLDNKEVFKALQDSDTYATVLHAICLNEIGDAIYSEDSLEIYARLKDAFGTELEEDNESKLMSMIVAVSTPYFYEDIAVFGTTCKTLVTGDAGLTDLDLEEPTLLEMLWGDYEVGLNAEALPYSPPVNAVVDQALEEERMEEGDAYTAHQPSLTSMALDLNNQLKAVGFAGVPAMPEVN